MGPKQGMFAWPFLDGDLVELARIGAAYAVRIGVGLQGGLLNEPHEIPKIRVCEVRQSIMIIQVGPLLKSLGAEKSG